MEPTSKISTKLPSKKILSLLIVVAALVFSIAIIFGKDKSSEAIESLGNIVSGQKITVPEKTDWQSELESVGVSGQNLLQASEEGSTTENNLTDSVSVNLISKYLALKQSGTLDNTSAQDLVEKTFNYIGASVDVSKNTKLNIVSDNGTQSIEEYANTLGSIIKKNMPAKPINEVAVIRAAVENNQPEKLKELDKVVAVYSKISDEIAVMKVPRSFNKVHLDLVNSLKGISSGIKDIQIIFDDPIKGVGGMKMYDENLSLFSNALKAVKLFTTQNKIAYKQGTGGYYLLYGI